MKKIILFLLNFSCLNLVFGQTNWEPIIESYQRTIGKTTFTLTSTELCWKIAGYSCWNDFEIRVNGITTNIRTHRDLDRYRNSVRLRDLYPYLDSSKYTVEVWTDYYHFTIPTNLFFFEMSTETSYISQSGNFLKIKTPTGFDYVDLVITDLADRIVFKDKMTHGSDTYVLNELSLRKGIYMAKIEYFSWSQSIKIIIR